MTSETRKYAQVKKDHWPLVITLGNEGQTARTFLASERAEPKQFEETTTVIGQMGRREKNKQG